MIGKEERWTSSKGNQDKWCENGFWYKADGLGYEALAEVVVSRLLEKTNVKDFVRYACGQRKRNGIFLPICSSKNFMMQTDDKIISVDRLFQIYCGESASKAVLNWTETEERIRYVVDTVERFTGLRDFGLYVKKLITIDALFLNEDRHFHNLAVIQRKDGIYRECPIFDNGASLFSDIKGDYPLGANLDDCYRKIQAKPFSTDFDEQLDACDILYGSFRFEAYFTMKDVQKLLMEFRGIYGKEILSRVEETLRIQMRKYSYMFV